jgi:hypothetical protein
MQAIPTARASVTAAAPGSRFSPAGKMKKEALEKVDSMNRRRDSVARRRFCMCPFNPFLLSAGSYNRIYTPFYSRFFVPAFVGFLQAIKPEQ